MTAKAIPKPPRVSPVRRSRHKSYPALTLPYGHDRLANVAIFSGLMSSSGTEQQSRVSPRLLVPRGRAIVLTLVLTALYASWDFSVPGEYNVAILYGSSVVASGWARSPRFLWFTTLVSVLLTYAGLAFGPQPPGGLLGAFYINRSLVALGLAGAAAIVHQRMKLRDHIDKARETERSQKSTVAGIAWRVASHPRRAGRSCAAGSKPPR